MSVAAPFVWIPRLAIAADRRGGLIESVQVYSNLTQLSALARYAPDLDPSEKTAHIENAAIVNSSSRLAQRNYVKAREAGCEIRADGGSGRVTYPAFLPGYQDFCLPFFHVNYADNSEIFTLQGPHLVTLSVLAEKIYAERRNKDLVRDLLYPNAQSSAANIGFERCNSSASANTDRIICPLSIVVLEYACQSGIATGAATATIYDRERQNVIYKAAVEYNIKG
jgi:hypothetical protein